MRKKYYKNPIFVLFILVTIVAMIYQSVSYSLAETITDTDTGEQLQVLEEESSEEDVLDSEEATAEETTPETSSEENINVVYDPQPVTMEEVQTVITAYEKEYHMVLEKQGLNSAFEVIKPHWEFEVIGVLMPEGYNCQLVNWDENFGGEYYTFFPNIKAASLISTNPNKFQNVGYRATPPVGAGIDISKLFDFVKYAGSDLDYPNVAVIADDTTYKYGAMWAKEKLNLALPFNTEMYLYLSHCGTKSGTTDLGDGMTFTLQNDQRGTKAIGSDGEGLGVYGSKYYEAYTGSTNPVAVIDKALSIEFDLYQNSYTDSGTVDHYMQDPTTVSSSGHCAVIYPPSPLATIRILPTNHINNFSFTKRTIWYPFTLKWQPVMTAGVLGGTLTYTFDGVTKNVVITDVKTVFGGTEAYWGFTGAAGGYSSGLAAAIKKLPTQGFKATKSVKDKNNIDINGGIAKVGDILRYKIEVEAKDTIVGIGPVKLTDTLSSDVEYVGNTDGKVLVTTQKVTSQVPDQSFYVTPEFTTQLDGSIVMTVPSNYTLVNEGDKMWFTFDVVANVSSEGKTVYNTAYLEADKLSQPQTTNTTAVNIVRASSKTVAAGSAGENHSTVHVGDEITYKINYMNGYGKTADLSITDNLPKGLVFIKATDQNGNEVAGYTLESRSIVWKIRGITNKAEGFVTITVRVTEDAGTTVTNKAELEWTFVDGSDPVIEEPETTNPLGSRKIVDESSESGKDGAAVHIGDLVTYKIIYNNSYGKTADLTITDKLPDGLNYISNTGGGTYYETGNKVVWTFADIEAGGSGTVTITVRVTEKAGEEVTNVAELVWVTEDGEQEPEKPEVTIPVIPEGSVEVTKVDAVDGSTLNGAQFYLYYTGTDSVKYYYSLNSTTGAVQWLAAGTTVPEGAKILITEGVDTEGNAKGKLEVKGLPYNTYTLEEIVPPLNYELSSQSIVTITIDAAHRLTKQTIKNSKILEFGFTKTNDDRTAVLSGATFTLYKWNNGEEVAGETELVTSGNANWIKYEESQVTAADGLVTFKGMKAGIYQLVEDDAPTDYLVPTGQWRVVIVLNQQTNMHEVESIMPIAGVNGEMPPDFGAALTTPGSGNYTLPNTKLPSFTFTKVAAEDERKPLEGAVFALYLWSGSGTPPEVVEDAGIVLDGWTLADTQISDEEGLVSFDNLSQNAVYQLVETKAPSGYSRPIGQWRITIGESGVNAPQEKGTTSPPAFYKGSDGSSLYLPNMKEKFFPFTGFGGIKNYLILGSGIMLLAVVCFLLFKRRRINIKNKYLIERMERSRRIG